MAINGAGGNRTHVHETIKLKRYVRISRFVSSDQWVALERRYLRPTPTLYGASGLPFPLRLRLPSLIKAQGASLSWLRRESKRRLRGLATEQRNNVIVGN